MHSAYFPYSRPHYGENLFTISSTSTNLNESKSQINDDADDDEDDDDENERTKLLETKKSNGYFNLFKDIKYQANNNNNINYEISSDVSLINENENANNCDNCDQGMSSACSSSSKCSYAPEKCFHNEVNNCPNDANQQECCDDEEFIDQTGYCVHTCCCRPILIFDPCITIAVNPYILKILFYIFLAFLVFTLMTILIFIFRADIIEVANDDIFIICFGDFNNNLPGDANFFEYLKALRTREALTVYFLTFLLIFIIIIHFPCFRRWKPFNYLFILIYIILLGLLLSLIVLHFKLDNLMFVMAGVTVMLIFLIIFTMLFSMYCRILFIHSYLFPYCLAIILVSVLILIFAIYIQFEFSQIQNFLLREVILQTIISFYIIFDVQYILSCNYAYRICICDTENLFKAFNMLTVDLFLVPFVLIKYVFEFIR